MKVNSVGVYEYPKHLGITHQQGRANISDHAPVFLRAELGQGKGVATTPTAATPKPATAATAKPATVASAVAHETVRIFISANKTQCECVLNDWNIE